MCDMLDKRAFHMAGLDNGLICRIQFPVQRQRTHIVERDNNQQYQHQASDNHGSYKEIAVVLNLTEEQVKVNLFRARQKVKQRFIDIEGYGL